MEQKDIVTMAEDTCELVKVASDLPTGIRPVLIAMASVICMIAKAVSAQSSPSGPKGD